MTGQDLALPLLVALCTFFAGGALITIGLGVISSMLHGGASGVGDDREE